MLMRAYIYVIIIQAIISWVRPDPFSPIVQILNKLTIPVYRIIRGRIPTVFNGVDIAPLIIVIFLQVLVYFFEELLIRLSIAI
jgi:YggT family protein